MTGREAGSASAGGSAGGSSNGGGDARRASTSGVSLFKPPVRRTATTPSAEHPLGLGSGLPRRVSSDSMPRRPTAGAAGVSSPPPASPASPAVAALQAAASASGIVVRREGSDPGGGPSRSNSTSKPNRKSTSTPRPKSHSTSTSTATATGAGATPTPKWEGKRRELDRVALFGDDDETPRRPRQARRSGTPLSGWGGYLDSLSRHEVEVLDTPFDVMGDRELAAVLKAYEGGEGKEVELELELDKEKERGRDGEEGDSSRPSTPPTVTPAAPLFPPSPGGVREHPLRVLARAVRELREVISRLEDDNARLRSVAASANASPARRPSGASVTALNIPLPTSHPTSAEASPRPVPLPSVAERLSGHGHVRTGDQLHGSLADALSTSLTSPTHSFLALRDEPGSPTPSTASASMRPRSPAPSTRSVRSERAASTASTAEGKDKKAWGLFGWAKKPGRKSSVSSLAPSIVAEDWRAGDGGSAPSFRAIFLATRILTRDPGSILLEPGRTSATIAGLAHALVSNARDAEIVVRDPPGRARARSRAASTSSTRQPPPIDTSVAESAAATGTGTGYGDQALAATVGLGRTLLSFSRNEGRKRPGLPPVRLPRAAYSPQSPHTPATPAPVDTPPPSVELGTIVPDESRPPTVLLSRQNLGSFFQSSRAKLPTATRFESDDPPLTDRYGFIYDIQHASMLKDASRAGTPAPISVTGHIPGADTLSVPPSSRPASTHSVEERRAPSPSSVRASESSLSPASASQVSVPEATSPPNGGTRSRRPTALEPPPAKAIAAKDELTVSVRGASNIQSGASSSLGGTVATSPAPSTKTSKASRLTVSSLLDQLTDIHDKQQKARTTEWDALLRRHQRRRGSVGVQDVGVSGAIAGVVSLAGTQSKSGQEQYRLFQRLVRRGIPIAYRADVWAECSGARDLLVPGEYAEILAVHRDDHSAVMAEIEKDVGRTFPGNVFFGGDGPGVAKLRRLLVAYSWHNPAVGYCQGMNMLAATLLLTFTDEEQAFWVLHCMVERLLPADYFAPSLVGSRADQLALTDLVVQHVPRVAAHLAALSVDLTSVTFGWFLSLFTDCLPVETLFRVWDVFFVEGHVVLFRVAVAILKINEAELTATESVSDLFTFISGMTSRLWGADKLIALQHSYKAAMRDTEITALVERHARALQRELDGDSE